MLLIMIELNRQPNNETFKTMTSILQSPFVVHTIPQLFLLDLYTQN